MTAVLDRQVFLLPSVVPGSGPFPGHRWRWSDPALTPGVKSLALSFYLALVTIECLNLIGAEGPVVVEGPFARNALYLDMLSLVAGRPVECARDAGRASLGAALLAGVAAPAAALVAHHAALDPDSAKRYGTAWARAVRRA